MPALAKKFPDTRGNWKVVTLEEAATQSFVAGDILKIDSAGQVSLGAAAGNDMTSSGTTVGGIALADASGVTGASIQVLVPKDLSAELSLPVSHGTPASAVTNKNQVSDTYVLTNDANSVWSVAIDTTSNPIVTVMAVDSTYAEGEQYGFLWVKFIPTVTFGLK